MEFGKALRPLWRLDPAVRFLNHGSYGATPRELLAIQQQWRDRMEDQPVRFMAEVMPKIREAAAVAARFVGTSADRFVFVENATAAINAVLRSLSFAPGDEILTTDHVYGAVRQTLRHVGAMTGARIVEAPLPLPVRGPGDVTNAIETAVNDRTRLVVIDHLASPSALIFPVAEITNLCRRRNILVLVDGAHAPGQIDLDIDALGADWYIGNFHKWICAPKGAGFLAVADRDLPAVHPPVISHFYGQGLTAEFDWIGTRDPTAWLTVPDAIAFHRKIGGAALRARNHALVADCAMRIADDIGFILSGPETMLGSMATLRLPSTASPSYENAMRIHDGLLQDFAIEAPVVAFRNALWLRLSAFAYNERADYAEAAQALRTILSRLD
jgi:isopenicillin-N epimerase